MSARIQPGNLYDRLIDLPEGVVGEIIDGELYTQPRPAAPHALKVHAGYGVAYCWLIDPPAKILEAYALDRDH